MPKLNNTHKKGNNQLEIGAMTGMSMKYKYYVHCRVEREVTSFSTSNNEEPALVNELSSSDCPVTHPTEGSSEMELEQPTSTNDLSSPRIHHLTNPSETLGSTKLPTPINILPQEEGPATISEGQIDLGVIIREVNGSWDRLRSVVQKMPDDKKKQYLSNHFKPSPAWRYPSLSPSNKEW